MDVDGSEEAVHGYYLFSVCGALVSRSSQRWPRPLRRRCTSREAFFNIKTRSASEFAVAVNRTR